MLGGGGPFAQPYFMMVLQNLNNIVELSAWTSNKTLSVHKIMKSCFVS